MAVAVSILPEQQLAVLNDAYRKAVARKRLRAIGATALFLAALTVAAIGAEVNLKTLVTYFGNFISYFDRILTLEDHTRVWSNFGEWFWGWQKWLKLLGETILISYVGTLIGASWISCMRFAVLPQVTAGYASYALLRFEINVREASVMGFVGAGGIGQELVVAIRKFYYSDVSAILVTIIVTVFLIDIGTGWLRGKLFGKEARA